MSKYTVYTDGSCNKDISYSFAFAVYKDGKFLVSKYGCSNTYASSRNISGELSAVVGAIKWCVSSNIREFTIVHDLVGTEKWATSSWKCNTDVTKAYKEFIDNITSLFNLHITWELVKGHTGVPGNELVDKLAYEAKDLTPKEFRMLFIHPVEIADASRY